MPDQPLPGRRYGQGAIQSPGDDRDFSIEDTPEFHLAAAIELPSKFVARDLPPVLDQGETPMCVAYSASSLKSWQDHKDQGQFFNFDEPRFFYSIGGNQNGAVGRYALQRMLDYGYPEYVTGNALKHRIKAYYAVPKSVTAIKTALLTFGPVLALGPWYNSWIHNIPSSGILPRPDWGGNGHQVLFTGWNDELNAFRFRNSWGSLWALQGDAFMPYYYATNTMWEYWKSIDRATSWGGRIRIAGPGCNIRSRPEFGDDHVWATSHRDGYTYRVGDGERLWRNSYQYYWDGEWVDNFARVKRHGGHLAFIHRQVAQIVVQP